MRRVEGSDERGLTLTELTLVMVLAAVVTVGLITFYANSQGVWLDASTQSLVQRDATLILERITDQVRGSQSARVTHAPETLELTSPTGECRFFWAADSMIHFGEGAAPLDRGPIVGAKIDRFDIDTDGTVVYVRRLSMRTSAGRPVELTSAIALYNTMGGP